MSPTSDSSLPAAPIRTASEKNGQIERIVLNQPKGNVLDAPMIEAIEGRIRSLAGSAADVKLVVFEGAGEHFSFGASVPEHLPDRIGAFLPRFHALVRDLEALNIPTAAIVRGRCLGGGLELASFCGMVFCDGSARFGVPEISLGVFPPLAAVALRWRIGGARAVRMIVTGEILDGERAAAIGLADDCSDDPEKALASWFTANLEGKSALSLRYAWRAARLPLTSSLGTELPELERLYLDDLMRNHDPVEGIRAFVEKRAPVWKNK